MAGPTILTCAYCDGDSRWVADTAIPRAAVQRLPDCGLETAQDPLRRSEELHAATQQYLTRAILFAQDVETPEWTWVIEEIDGNMHISEFPSSHPA